MDFLQTYRLRKLPVYLYRYLKHTKETLIGLDLGIYWFWVTVRIVLTLVPQSGYIHPDEYFQTVEVFAGIINEISQPHFFFFRLNCTLHRQINFR